MHSEYAEAELTFFMQQAVQNGQLGGLMLDSIREIKLALAVTSSTLLSGLESCPSGSTYRAIHEAQAKIGMLTELCDSVEKAVVQRPAPPAPKP